MILQFPLKCSPERDWSWMAAVCRKSIFKDSPETACRAMLVCGVHCIDVTVHLVPQWEPGFVGEVGLWAADAAAAVPFTAPGRGGAQTGLQLFTHYSSLRRALSFAPLLAASVEGKALEHFYTHISRGRGYSLKTSVLWHCKAQRIFFKFLQGSCDRWNSLIVH